LVWGDVNDCSFRRVRSLLMRLPQYEVTAENPATVFP
jgi:hypothetical protein